MDQVFLDIEKGMDDDKMYTMPSFIAKLPGCL